MADFSQSRVKPVTKAGSVCDLQRMPDEPAARGDARPARVVVIGGGFSGTLTAVNLVRLADDPLEITIADAGRRRPVQGASPTGVGARNTC